MKAIVTDDSGEEQGVVELFPSIVDNHRGVEVFIGTLPIGWHANVQPSEEFMEELHYWIKWYNENSIDAVSYLEHKIAAAVLDDLWIGLESI